MKTGDDYNANRTHWTPRMEKGASSKHQAIFDAIVADIANGRLRLGDRLPPQRAVAGMLGVDLTTVTKAYSRARAEGIIEATTGRGSFVSKGANEHRIMPVGTALTDLGRNSPPRSSKVDLALTKEIESALQLDAGAAIMNYQDTGGSWANRTAAAVWLAKRLPSCPSERIVLSSGAQSAIFAICHLLTGASKHIAVGQFAYPGIHTAAFQQGLQLVPLAMDASGILPDSFEDACKRLGVGTLYITPTADNPTTATLPLDRREKIARIARLYKVSIIEDEPYYELMRSPLPPLAALAPELTWHIATLSKCVSPALRLGFVAAPSIEAATRVAAILQAMTMMASPLFAALISRWVYSGFLEEAAISIRAENVERHAIACRVLDGQDFSANEEAPHIWLRLPSPWRAIDFTHQCERHGVIVPGSSTFSVNSPTVEAARISIGAAPSRVALENALLTLQSILRHGNANANRATV